MGLIPDLQLQKHKKPEDDLRKSEESFRLLVNGVKDYAIFMLNTDGLVVTWNEGAANIKGYSSGEIIGKYISIFYTEDEIELGEPEHNLEMARKNGRFEKEDRRKRKDGSVFWANVVFTAIYDDDKQLLGFAKITRDITERKNAEKQIAYLANLVEQSNDAIISLDKNSCIRSWNRGAEKLYGYKEEEVIGKNFRNITKSQVTEIQLEEISKDLDEKKGWQGEDIHLRADGSPVCCLISVASIEDPNDNISGYVFTSRDISNRKRLEDQLKMFNEELEEQVRVKTNQLLQERNLLRTLIDNLPDYIYVKDLDLRHLINNTANILLIGALSEEETLGKTVFDYFKPELAELYTEDDRQILRSKKPVIDREEPIYTSDGIRRWLLTTKLPLKDKNNNIVGLVGISRDITERKMAEEQVAKEKELSDSTINSLPGIFYLFDSNGKFLRWNNNFETVSGYNSEEINKMSPIDFFEGDEKDYITARIEKVFAEGISDVEAQFLTRTGRKIPYYFTGRSISYGGQTCLIGTGIDISLRLKAEENLKKSYEEIRLLASHLQDVREEERAGMAREIHDELGQQLTGLKMDMSWISKKLNSREDAQTKGKINGTLELLDETIKTVRRIATELRPSILDDLGLIAAIEWQSQEFEKRTGITTHFESEISEFDFAPGVAIGLFRICQESLTNVARHSEAKNVFLTLRKKDGGFLLTIADDGKGFDIDKIGFKKTLGLVGMRERTLMMGGKYEINTEPGHGTSLFVSIPYESSRI